MAQTGFTPIQIYNSTTPGVIPSAGSLIAGELGFNISDADMALFAKNASNVVKRIMNNPAGLKYPTADGSAANQVIKTDGSGNLAFLTLTASRALVSDANGGLGVSATTSTELGYVAGVTSAIQTQINTKAPSASPSFSGSVSLSDGTANGVCYLNGAKALTSDSGLVFDGARLGLGVIPSAWSTGRVIQVGAGVSLYNYGSYVDQLALISNAVYTSGWRYIGAGKAAMYEMYQGAHIWSIAGTGTEGSTASFAQAMTLNASGNLGIGTTSPGANVHVNPSGQNANNAFWVSNSIAETAPYVRVNTGHSSYDYQVGGSVYDNYVMSVGTKGGSDGNYASLITTGKTVLAYTAGNVGIGVVPSAWTSIDKALEFGRSGNALLSVGVNDCTVTSNVYYSGGWKFGANGYANRFNIGSANGQFQWFVSTTSNGSGAGAVAAFTQAMALGTSALNPGSDNTMSCGTVTYRWSGLCAASGTITTSDAREKTSVRKLSSAELAAAIDLSREIGVYQFLASVAEKGEDTARLHVGLTVQRAVEIFETHGLDAMGYGLVCYDEWPEEVREHPAIEAQPAIEAAEAWTEVVTPAGNRYGFRYDELNQLIAAGFAARLDALEKK